jgi:hypothetical protein
MTHPEEYDLWVLGSARARFLAWSMAASKSRKRSRFRILEKGEQS